MSRRVWAGVVFGVALLSIVAAALFTGGEGGVDRVGTSQDAVGIIDINGVIVGSSPDDVFGTTASVDRIVDDLEEAQADASIRAVVLRLNSPGGSAAASQEIGDAVMRLRESGKVVVASMSDVAASGAYWIACETNSIVANPATMTGSIGVIMETTQIMGLYDKLGVSNEVFKSGPYKDMGSATRPVTENERAIFQSMINDIYAQFVDVVSEGRDMNRDKVLALADGRVFTGRQALAEGLVDELGGLEEAVNLAADMAGIKGEPRVVEIGAPDLWGLFRSGISSLQRTSDLRGWLLMDPVIQQR